MHRAERTRVTRPGCKVNQFYISIITSTAYCASVFQLSNHRSVELTTQRTETDTHTETDSICYSLADVRWARLISPFHSLPYPRPGTQSKTHYSGVHSKKNNHDDPSVQTQSEFVFSFPRAQSNNSRGVRAIRWSLLPGLGPAVQPSRLLVHFLFMYSIYL